MKRVVPGIHSVYEALLSRPESVLEIWLKEDRLHKDLEKVLNIAVDKKITVKRYSSKRLDQQVASHQGVIAFVNDSPSWPDRNRLKDSKHSLILVCDSLEDPHNFGSLMRSAWNLGVMGVIYNKDRSAGGAPSAQKVASGAFEHVPVLGAANLQAELTLLKEFGFWVYGLEERAKKSMFSMDFPPKVALVVGSEESGLRKTTRDVCDEFISIPSSPKASSLNVAVAGAIAMYEVVKQKSFLRK